MTSPTDSLLITEIKNERNRLIRENDRLQSRPEREIEYSRSLNEKIVSLEREIASLGWSGKGISGYLRDGLKRIVEKLDTEYSHED